MNSIDHFHCVGVLVWTSAEREVDAFHYSVLNSVLAGIGGFILIEVLIYFGIQVGQKTEIQRYQNQVMALTDGLTGILNRRGFDGIIKKEFDRAIRGNLDLSIAICDIDYFKQYNDHYGHLKGDDCLKKLTQCLEANMRRSVDVVARYGGEEFVIILPLMNREDALLFIDYLRLSVERLQIPHTESQVSPWVTISCGIASTKGKSTCTSETELLSLADTALYQAKNTGRNRAILSKKSNAQGL